MNLYPFQEASVEKMLHFLQTNEAHATYCAHEMGLGKSIISIECARRLQAKRILILCPAIMRLVWLDELKTWYSEGKVNLYLNSTATHSFELSSSESYSSGPIWTICSYDLSHRERVLSKLEESQYDLAIFDEAHYLKNRRAKRTRAAYANLWNRSCYHILLSGTPFTSHIVDGYTSFHKCAPTIFPNFADFVGRFCYERRVPWGRGVEYFGLKNADELSNIIRSNFYLRYKKEEVLPELPDKQFQKILLPTSYAVTCQSNDEEVQLRFEAEKIARAIQTGVTPVVPKSLAEHRRLQGEAKIAPVAEFAANLLEQNIPIVLYAWHKNVIHGLAEALKEFNPAVITGETPAGARHEAIKRFQGGGGTSLLGFMRGDTNLFLANMLAAGTGITLTRSSTVILAELDWTPAVVNQAIARVHRIGQKNSVLIYYFVVSSSLDEAITNTVISKTKLFEKVLDNALPS